MEEQQLPGFRFHPTEEELVGFYLRRKVEKESFKFNLIKDLELYAFEPWHLPGLAVKRGESEWFFFVKPRGHSDGRPNRITDAGFWKATGTDKPVYNHSTSTIIGFRKTLVFYKGRAVKGHKTDWIMNEYKLYPGGSNNGEDVRLCRVYRKSTSIRSFDRRPSIQAEKKVNSDDNLASNVQTSNFSKFSEHTSTHSFGEYKFGKERRMSMVNPVENLYTPKIEAEICDSEREYLTRFDSLEGWWCCGGGTSNSMDTICTNVVLSDCLDI